MFILTTSGQGLGFGLIGKLPTPRTVPMVLLSLPLTIQHFSLISDWFRGVKLSHQTPNMASSGCLKVCHLDVLTIPYKAFLECQIIFFFFGIYL